MNIHGYSRTFAFQNTRTLMVIHEYSRSIIHEHLRSFANIYVPRTKAPEALIYGNLRAFAGIHVLKIIAKNCCSIAGNCCLNEKFMNIHGYLWVFTF